MAPAILITGANRGLGFEFARQYVADGWRVFGACRCPAAATKLQRLAQDTEGMLNIVAMESFSRCDQKVSNADFPKATEPRVEPTAPNKSENSCVSDLKL